MDEGNLPTQPLRIPNSFPKPYVVDYEIICYSKKIIVMSISQAQSSRRIAGWRKEADIHGLYNFSLDVFIDY